MRPAGGRRSALVAVLCAAMLLMGCTDSTDSSEQSEESPTTADGGSLTAGGQPGGDPLADVDRERYVDTCQIAGEADVDVSCPQLVDEAIDSAGEYGCEPLALDAFFEHGLAYRFESVPEPEFFERCPRPLSSLMMIEGPPGYERVATPAGDVGLMTTTQVAAQFQAETWEGYLAEVGHQVSYGRRWQRGEVDSVLVRLDRFASVEGAMNVTAPSPNEDGTVILAVDDARIVTMQSLDPDRTNYRALPYQQLAFGRVCDLAVTVFFLSTDDFVDEELVADFFRSQAYRLQRVVTC